MKLQFNFKPWILWIAFGFFVLPQTSNAQRLEEFPHDSAKFIETLSEFLEKRISDSKEEKFDKFREYWESGKFTPAKRDTIVSMANTMLQNGASRSPHFTLLLDVLIKLNNTDFDAEYFPVWMKGFRHLTREKKRNLKKITDYFQFTINFIRSGSLYSSRTRTWYDGGSNYQFVYDTTIKIIYSEISLKCKQRDDSIRIYETEGVYFPFKKKWKGNGGRVTWERAGYSPEKVYAQLNDYAIDMSKAEYHADSVKFINKLYFDHPILGTLDEKLLHVIKPQDAVFPVFNSYQKFFEIPGIYNNMDFTGGFQMKGAQFIGTSGNGKDATIEVHRNGKNLMTARAETFILRKNKALSRSASVTFYLKQDSIYHTGLQFTYNAENQNIELTSNDNILSKSVYYNTYHQVSMNFDRLLWNTSENKIYITRSKNSSRGQATFTSMNYFTLDEWLQLEMHDRIHPLIALRNYHNKIDSRKFEAAEFAKHIKLPTHQVRQRLMYLAQKGFVFYNLESDRVTINEKLFDYIRARIGNIDYDVIRLNSSVESPEHNAILDLSNMNLNIKGVQRIFVSDSQKVAIYPDGKELTMKKNRQFDFGGVVEGGLFTFFGDSMSFDYKNFDIAMNTIDSLHIQYKTDERNAYGQKLLANVQNTINDLTGTLHIDHPNNKSGRKNYPEYPIFKGEQKSYVYYNDLFNGVYKKENFYFELDPFTMDSLNNFQPEDIELKGKFYSAGIFPPFKETLVLRDDNSLGFEKTTSEEGLPLYDGKGQFYQNISMSNKGLKGQGKLTYLTSTAVTDDILFFPDSTSIYAKEFTIAQKTTGIEYPEVASNGVNIKWYPKEDVMHIRQPDEGLTMYNGKSSLAGYLNLKPTGLRGKGKLNMQKAVLTSQQFNFESQTFVADTANFVLRTLSQDAVAFRSDTLNAHVNYDYQTARFNTINNYSVAEFPQNLYLSYLDEFVWKMNKDTLKVESAPEAKAKDDRTSELERLKDGEPEGALYMSTHKSQDSLRFTSEEMTYSIADNTMNAKNVKHIISADAKIFPNGQNLTIRKDASMDTLKEARLMAGRKKKYHEIFNADIKIHGRNHYEGKGDYHYENRDNNLQTIHFDEIGVDDSLHTYAEGSIEATDSFKLNPHFGFAGEVKLKARRKLLEFKGGARMTHNCKGISPRHVYFESVINPDSIYIPIREQSRDLKGNKLFAGSYITLDSTHIYSTFLTPRKDPSDDLIISADGYLNYDEQSGKYQLASPIKLQNPDTAGTYLSLNKKTCRYHAEGNMYLGVDYSHLTIHPAGELDHNLPENDITLNITLPVKFHFSNAALDSMVNDINGRADLKSANIHSEFYENNLNEIVGQQTTSQYMEVMNQDAVSIGEKKSIPEKLHHTLIFSDLHFNWNTTTNSYVARDEINIAMINGKPVNKKMKGFVEIVKQKHNDKLYIYLQPDSERYYMFYFSRRMMRTYSDNRGFVEAIKEVPDRKREIGGGLFSRVDYRYLLATETIRSRVINHINDVKEVIRKEKQDKMARDNEGEGSGHQNSNELNNANEQGDKQKQPESKNEEEQQQNQ
ncbi:MAG: hypothetical protein K9H65_04035 [Bacteroidales bacterium]|nr:hypothetical protein [Bacteroidales bacterium]